MISMLILLCFFVLSILIFIINNIHVLLLILLLDLIILMFKVSINNILKLIYKNLLFVIFIFICNLLFTSLYIAIMTSLRLYIAICFTYTVSVILSISKVADGFYYLFYPLKLFKVNIKSMSLVISIAITFIPILINEATNIKYSLISKGFDFNIKNVFTRPHIFLITYFNNIFNRVDMLEKALLMKGYE